MRLITITAALVSALALVSAASAVVQTGPVEPDAHASCAALFSVVETHGTLWPSRQSLAQSLRSLAAAQGTSPGQLYSDFAQAHAGQYAYCDLVGLGVPLP